MKIFIYYILIFYTYAFIGWFQEVIQTLIKQHKFINRGFLIGPLCPIYGFGAMFITLLLTPIKKDSFTVFIGSILICAILEYFTSWLFEKVFKARWWDYTNKPYNLNGRICLLYSIAFGFGAVLVLYLINPYFVDIIYNNVPINISMAIISGFILLTIIDMAVSFKIIFKLKHISNSVKSDNTEQITKEVKSVLAKSTKPYRRILESFPDMKINNRMSIIKKKIEASKDKYLEIKEKQKEKIKNLKNIKKNTNK